MKLARFSLSLALAVASTGLGLSAKADTAPAHCDLFRPNGKYPDFSSNCTFSQRQGFVSIQFQANGARYEFSPIPNSASGNFRDQNGNPAYRQAGLGNDGVIFQLADGYKIYVYWDQDSSFGTGPVAQGTRVGTLIANDRGSQINLRSQPTAQSRAVGYGLAGDKVNILKCQKDTDSAGSSLNWCQVKFMESGAVGWIRSDFIEFPSDGSL